MTLAARHAPQTEAATAPKTKVDLGVEELVAEKTGMEVMVAVEERAVRGPRPPSRADDDRSLRRLAH